MALHYVLLMVMLVWHAGTPVAPIAPGHPIRAIGPARPHTGATGTH